MYKKVETENDKIEFKRLYSSFVIEENNGYYLEEHGSEQYLIFQKDSPIGTIEFQLLDANNEYSIKKIFNPFDNHAILKLSYQNVFLLSKLSLKKEYRGRGYFLDLLRVIYDYQLKNGIDWYTGVLNKPVFEMVHKKGFKIEKIGEEIILGSITLVPFLLDIRQAEKVFLRMQRLKERNIKQEMMV